MLPIGETPREIVVTVLLIAEDDEDIAALLLRVFRKTSFTVSRASDGA